MWTEFGRKNVTLLGTSDCVSLSFSVYINAATLGMAYFFTTVARIRITCCEWESNHVNCCIRSIPKQKVTPQDVVCDRQWLLK